MKHINKKDKIINSINPTKYSKNNFKFTIDSTDNQVTFYAQNLKDFPIKTYGLELTLSDLEKMEEFENIVFKNMNKFADFIRKIINSDRYDINFGNNEKNGNYVSLIIKSELFSNDRVEIKLPEKGYDFDLKSQIESLKNSVDEIKQNIENCKLNFSENEKLKEECAKNSFYGTTILNNDEKILISKFIHPSKIIKFNLVYTTKDSFDCKYFHDYCDDISPIIIVIYDNSGRKFGGYSTRSFRQPSSVANNYCCRAPESFLFSLTNKKKYELIDKNSQYAIYRNNSYGPSFGFNSSGPSYHDLLISNNSNSSSCYCQKNIYNTDGNLLGSSGQSSFTVNTFEAYQVIFE